MSAIMARATMVRVVIMPVSIPAFVIRIVIPDDRGGGGHISRTIICRPFGNAAGERTGDKQAKNWR